MIELLHHFSPRALLYLWCCALRHVQVEPRVRKESVLRFPLLQEGSAHRYERSCRSLQESNLPYRGHLLYLLQPGKGAADLYALLHHITKISCQFYTSTCPSLFGFLIMEVRGDAIVTFAAPGREFLYKGWSRPWTSRQDQEPLPQAGRGTVCH